MSAGTSSFDAVDPQGPPSIFDDLKDAEAEREMSEFTLGPREALCTKCFLIHRFEVGCDG